MVVAAADVEDPVLHKAVAAWGFVTTQTAGQDSSTSSVLRNGGGGGSLVRDVSLHSTKGPDKPLFSIAGREESVDTVSLEATSCPAAGRGAA